MGPRDSIFAANHLQGYRLTSKQQMTLVQLPEKLRALLLQEPLHLSVSWTSRTWSFL